MDFGSVLQVAQKNNGGRNGSNFYKTKFEPPKKEAKSKQLSQNIRKFLAKKEEEDRRKQEESRRKRDELLAMRDPKATNKIKKMLKVIKSANKSVLEEAVDNDNTAVTMHGPDQPDEDDYGYVSQEASAYYSKMMEKYKKLPDEEKFPTGKKVADGDLLGTKDRVRAAILRQQAEEMLPHRRKRKQRTYNDDSFIQDEIEYVTSNDKKETKEEKPKPKRPMPPPLDFSELLKIAEKKQFEPVVVETKKTESMEEPERLMTKRQKREYEEMRAYQEAKSRREKDKERDKESSSGGKSDRPKSTSSKPSGSGISSMRIPKLSDRASNASSSKTDDRKPDSKNECLPKSSIKKDDSAKVLMNKNTNQSKSSSDRHGTPPVSNGKSQSSSQSFKRSREPSQSDLRSDSSKKMKTDQYKKTLDSENKPGSSSILRAVIEQRLPNSKMGDKYKNSNQRPASSNEKGQLLNKSSDKRMEKRPQFNGARPSNLKSDRPSDGVNKTSLPNSKTSLQNIKQIRKPDVTSKPMPQNNAPKSRPFPPNDLQKGRPSDVQKSRQFPPPDVQKARQFPPNDVKRREMIMKREKLKKRRILDDDDSEYDSSLEDFIDDGPEEAGDVSSYIKEIFGYDKSRYRDVDDDDRNMESNFSQVMREEYISKKIGLMEDLEDMKMEALEKKKKSIKKQKK